MVVPFSKKSPPMPGHAAIVRASKLRSSPGVPIGLEETAMHSNLWERSEKTERKV